MHTGELPAMRVEKRLQVLIVVAAAFCFVPLLFFMQDIWDGKHIGYALRTGDDDWLWHLLIPTRWTLQYYLFLGIEFIQNTFGIYYKVVTNVLSCLSLAGICVEIARIMDEELGLEREYRLLAVLAFLVLPPWATLMASMLFFHISCVWAFLLAVRWRRSAPVPAVLLLVYSLALNSVFAFAVGYALFLAILTVDQGNWRKVGLRTFLFSAVLLAAFVLYRHFFPPFGSVVGYNSFNLRVSALYNYAGLFAILLGGAWLLMRGTDADRLRELRIVAACCALVFFAGFAYTYVGKPIKLEGTNSFTPRQTFLVAVPTAMLMGVMVRLCARRMGRRVAYGLAGAVLLLSFCYQFSAFQQKYAQLYFENAVAELFRAKEPPRPGIVIFETDRDQVPKYLRDFSSVADYIPFEAYGEKQWLTWVCGEQDCRVKEKRLQGWKRLLVDQRGLSPDDLYLTRIRLDLNGFDPFGNPMVYYYYITDDFDRLGFKMEYRDVEKLD